MITVKAIFIEGAYSPETNETKGFGSHFDGVNFYFFESDDDRDNFYKNDIK